ncbi:trypsin-like serine protease [Cellulosimicrobium sp. BIT-GX5]|uniref:Trypsin-like serine protease n=1 Tax=Cellulosimicrobium composti TaxID=2672572 RepID=A0A6N7ZP49_9MICO|nr:MULTISPECIES: serine protease [Cellulosimicrobium]MTG90958.1 trypsin-like serine protease [Cellulosimicrobium composti]TWG82294.1 Trypsin-like serine proteases, typically periplasmic, containing C-terminal PDZ domain [Cellulosimicrobium cellulans J34]SMF34131.1 Trypsin-like serine proteases, typically periplasmic, contain C-terminal PDZ domain [Cellulosimicrobium cellulans J1]
MTRGPRRVVALAVAGTLGAGALAGCGVLPELPDPVPDSVVPSLVAPDDPAGSENLSPDGFDAVRRMAVRIRNVRCDGLSTGSGFAVDSRTLITNKHVVDSSRSLQLLTYDGRDIAAQTASVAGLADLAIVRTAEDLPSAPTLAAADPAPGDAVTVVGYPEGGRLTVTQGAVIGTTTDPLNENLGEVLVTDAPVEPGSSGSAALNDAGEVIGVVYAKTSTDKSLLVPVSTLQTLLGDESAFTELPECDA